MKHLSVYIADDQTLFREGMVTLLESFDFVRTVKGVENGEEVIKLIKTSIPDVVLMDYRMPVMDGKEASSYILKKFPEVKIIMLSFYDCQDKIVEMMELGVHSYLLKEASSEEVQRAIKAVVQNDFYSNKLIADAMRVSLTNTKNTHPASGENLSERELEIVRLTCQELSSKEIAEKLYISNRTVQHHRASIIKKLGVRNTIGMVKYAIYHGLTH